jgi:hypothetical protein
MLTSSLASRPLVPSSLGLTDNVLSTGGHTTGCGGRNYAEQIRSAESDLFNVLEESEAVVPT